MIQLGHKDNKRMKKLIIYLIIALSYLSLGIFILYRVIINKGTSIEPILYFIGSLFLSNILSRGVK